MKGYKIYTVLVHNPINDKKGDVVTTAVTNFDVHDIARISKTFDCKTYYITNPIMEQQQLVQRIIDHWGGEYGRKKNTARQEALGIVKVLPFLEDVIYDIKQKEGVSPIAIATSARNSKNSISFEKLGEVADKETPLLFVFGTGWGLAKVAIDKLDYILEPLKYDTKYNHLPVRSAVSIIMDRVYNVL